MGVLGIIPARAGSKRIKNKNIVDLYGKPLIQYTIESAKNASLLNNCIISTDSEEIKSTAELIGGKVPFLRPTHLSKDDTSDRPVLKHAIEWVIKNEGFNPEYVILLRPTSPFRTGKMIDDAIKLITDTGADSVRSMTKVEGVHHPFWMFKSDSNNKALPLDKENSIDKYYQSQLLPPVYRLNGVVDIIKTEVILNDNLPLYGNDMRILEIPEELAIDIDTPFDLKVCEILMKEKSHK